MSRFLNYLDEKCGKDHKKEDKKKKKEKIEEAKDMGKFESMIKNMKIKFKDYMNETKIINEEVNQEILDFIKKQLSIYTRTHNLKTKEEIANAMKKNMEKWIKMFLTIKK